MTSPPDLPPKAVQAVGGAIQDLAAARLGRAFLPLALIFLAGVGDMLTGERGLVLSAGAPLAAGAMLTYGMKVVQRGFGRPPRPWMALSPVVGILPPALGLYVLGWRGLRVLASLDGIQAMAAGLFFTLVGLWVLRAWVKLLELARLAEVMLMGDATGGSE